MDKEHIKETVRQKAIAEEVMLQALKEIEEEGESCTVDTLFSRAGGWEYTTRRDCENFLQKHNNMG